MKDVLIAIPFFASALALTWEVGFFSVIKGGSFGIFSIAEHITFALQALPIALFLSTAFVGGSVQHSLLERYVYPRLALVPQERRRRVQIRILVIALIVNILLTVGSFTHVLLQASC